MRIYIVGTTEVTSSLFTTINYSLHRDGINQVLKANEIVFVSTLHHVHYCMHITVYALSVVDVFAVGMRLRGH